MITNNNKTIQSVNIGNKTVASLTNGGEQDN